MAKFEMKKFDFRISEPTSTSANELSIAAAASVADPSRCTRPTMPNTIIWPSALQQAKGCSQSDDTVADNDRMHCSILCSSEEENLRLFFIM